MTDRAAALGRNWLRFLPLGAVAIVSIGVIGSGALRQLSLSNLSQHQALLSALVARHPLAALAAYVALYVLVIVACTPGPFMLAIAGGVLFGWILGGVAAMAAMIAGGLLVFAACRTAFGDWAAQRAGPTLAKIEAGFSSNALSYLLALRLLPGAPFFMVNLAAGLARIRTSTFLIATLVGSSPSAFILASLGAGLRHAVKGGARLDASLAMRPDIALPLTGLAFLALAPPLWRTLRRSRP
jgi:uncharacterized membrane protein YdjX (TVP38/TMEM64 family)